MTSYIVWCPDDGESKETAMSISAWDAYTAACRWAEIIDALKYRIAEGEQKKIIVRKANRPFHAWEFTVHGKWRPVYDAKCHGRKDDA